MRDPLPTSKELREIIRESQRLAIDTQRRWGTMHLLLAFFVSERNRAREILQLCRVELDQILKKLEKRRKTVEEPTLVNDVLRKAEELTRRTGHTRVNTLHLFTALCRTPDCLCYKLLVDVGADPGRLRSVAMRNISEGRPRASMNPAARADTQEPESLAILAPLADSGSSNSPFENPFAEAEAPRNIVVEATPTPPAKPTPPKKKKAKKPAPQPAAQAPEPEVESEFELDPDEYPILTSMGRNLSQLVAQGSVDPAIGRDREVELLLDVLLKRRSNNPLLIGEPGVGKTAIVEGLAQRLQMLAESDPMRGAILIEIPISSLDAGTQLRGAFTERMQGLMDEVARADGNIVIFFDEIHLLMGTGAGDGALDAGNVLKAALARGHFPCIGATTVVEYTRTIEKDTALARRFTTVYVAEPDTEAAIEMLQGVLRNYAKHHGVEYQEDVAEAAVALSRRYIPERSLPDKAIALIDKAGSRARRAGRSIVDQEDIANVVASLTDIPASKILVTDQERLLDMEEHLSDHIVGHDSEIHALSRVIRRNFAGFRSRRPVGSFILLGPTGVGKTETARVLARYFFQKADALQRFDMSEYGDRTSVNKLIGAPAGYEGHDEIPSLTRAVWKRPHQVLLFDEVEKSDPSLWPIFLQMLDEGTVEDRRGVRLDFRESIIIMTTNLGANTLRSSDRGIGFSARENEVDGDQRKMQRERMRDRVLEEARKHLPPELWARFDERMVYLPLESDELRRVAEMLVAEQSAILDQERGIQLRINPDALDHILLVAGKADTRDGARSLRRVIEEHLVDAVAQYLLGHTVGPGTLLSIRLVGEKLSVDTVTSESQKDDTVVEKVRSLARAES